MDSMDITFYILYKPEYPKYPMGIGMRIDFENPMDIGMNMGMTFENKYGWGYSYTRPELASRSSLIDSSSMRDGYVIWPIAFEKNINQTTLIG